MKSPVKITYFQLQKNKDIYIEGVYIGYDCASSLSFLCLSFIFLLCLICLNLDHSISMLFSLYSYM